MKYIPKWLTVQLVEAVLDQPNPTKEVQTVLNHCLNEGLHPDKLIGRGFVLVK